MEVAPKPRSDAWCASLSEAQRWDIYFRMQRGRWTEVCKWISKELDINPPSRSALYEFTKRMREAESGHRIEQAILARQEAGELASKGSQNDEDLIETYKAMAADLALRLGDAEGATAFTKLALDLADAHNQQAIIDLKSKAQATKDKQLKLAREKFEAAENRLQATADVVKQLNATGGLTPEAREIIEKAMGML